MEVIKTFGNKGKLMIGHCAAAMMFDFTGITNGKKNSSTSSGKTSYTKWNSYR